MNSRLVNCGSIMAIICFILSFGAHSMASAVHLSKPILVLREGLDGTINEWSGPAKFVLYNDGTVITERSDETRANIDDLSYFRDHLTHIQFQRLIKSLNVKNIMTVSQSRYGTGEGISRQLIFWLNGKPRSILIIGPLKQAPSNLVNLIQRLEQFPKRGVKYLNYDYILTFRKATGKTSIAWPRILRSPKLLQNKLGIGDVYQYNLDARNAQWIRAKLAKANTQNLSINGYVWRVDFNSVPQLPFDTLWR